VGEPDWSPPAIAQRIDEARQRIFIRNERTGKVEVMSQGELERRVGMTKPGARGRGYIAKLRANDRGTSLKIEWIVKLALELKVEMPWLLAGIGPRERPADAPPAGGRELGLFIAAITGQPPNIIDAVRKELAGKEHENESPLFVANIVEHRAKVQRNTEASQAIHAKLGKERGEKIEREKRKAKRAEERAAKKKPQEPKIETTPPPRKIAVDED
jgi:hypothetical protein